MRLRASYITSILLFSWVLFYHPPSVEASPLPTCTQGQHGQWRVQEIGGGMVLLGIEQSPQIVACWFLPEQHVFAGPTPIKYRTKLSSPPMCRNGETGEWQVLGAVDVTWHLAITHPRTTEIICLMWPTQHIWAGVPATNFSGGYRPQVNFRR